MSAFTALHARRTASSLANTRTTTASQARQEGCPLLPSAQQPCFLRQSVPCYRQACGQAHTRSAAPARTSRPARWVAHAASGGAALQKNASKGDARAALSVILVLLLGVLNRVLNKMATVPMGQYLFFLAQVQTFGYVLFYGAFLMQRRRAGVVTDEMLRAPDKRGFVAIGFLEAAAQLISMFCIAKLPGVVIPLLQQTTLLWQVALGYLVQGQRFHVVQLVGIMLVAAGVALAAWPSSAGVSVLGQTHPGYAALFCFAFLLLAVDALVKDSIFSSAKRKLGGKPLDLFIVNTNGSLAQAGFVLLLLPVLSSLKGIPFRQLPSYFSEGFRTLAGMTPSATGAPLVPVAYIAVNLAMNVSVLNLLRTTGPVVTTLSLSALVPLSIWAFTWPWPLIGAPATLSSGFIGGTVLLLAGLAAYNWSALQKS